MLCTRASQCKLKLADCYVTTVCRPTTVDSLFEELLIYFIDVLGQCFGCEHEETFYRLIAAGLCQKHGKGDVRERDIF
ncbi:hypothetical protein HOLleu_39787 [Holothuria leucospilota]|uniref:Uncharacterized protein n=1 Tax=Holothuria leucospilota TaxID=206669 RepID=A0A9Q0YDD8_HOLLE|nr:hypothetical protein HOLleu_39787 [Holothuria leucospilota]